MSSEFLREVWSAIQSQFSLVDEDDVVEDRSHESLESIIE